MQRFAKNIYVESGYAGVTVGAIVTQAGIVCIDSPTHPADARRWQQRLAQLSNRPVLYIINLDHHRDRVLGNSLLEAPVIAHELTYERVRLMPETHKGLSSESGADADLATDLAGARIVTPSLTFTDRMTLVKGGVELQLTHRPGPAPGAIWVELPAQGVAFVGDTVTHGVPPLMQDCQIDAWLEQLAEMGRKRFAVKTIVPGRGSPLNKAGLKPTVDFLRLARRRVASLARGGKGRAAAGALAEELLKASFSVPASRREHFTRRLRVGLEHLYDALAAEGH